MTVIYNTTVIGRWGCAVLSTFQAARLHSGLALFIVFHGLHAGSLSARVYKMLIRFHIRISRLLSIFEVRWYGAWEVLCVKAC